MAGNIPMGSMSTEIKLNGSQSVKTLRELKQAVTQATSAWKAQRAELASIGKSTEAAESKFKGLGESIKKQKDYITGLQEAQKHLTEAQKSVDKSTREGRQEYGKYNEALQKNETRIHSAEQKLVSLTNQQTKAKSSLNYYKSGLADVQKQLKTNESVAKSYVERLKAEGKGYESAKAKLSGYKSSLENLNKQQKIQAQELARIASEFGKSSDAYKRQEIRLNQTATTLAKTKSAMNELNSSMHKANPTVFDKLKTKLTGLDSQAEKTHRTFKEVFMGSALGNALSNSLSNIGSSLKNAYEEGMNLNLAVAKINGRFKGMGMSTRQIQSLDKQLGKLKANTAMTGDNVANLQAHMLNWSTIGTKGAMQMAKTIAGVGDTSKLTGDQIERVSASLQRVGSTGKVTYSSLSRITKAAPTFMQALAKGAGMSQSKMIALLKTGKVTQKQFQQWMASASKYSDDAFKGFGKTQAGALKSMQVARQKLEQQFTKPIFDAKTSGLQALKNIMTSKAVMNGAQQLGKAISNMIGFLDKHKSDIVAITKNVVSLGVEVGKAVWKDFAAIIQNIGKTLGIVKGNGKESSSALHTLATATADLAKNKTAIKAISDAIIAMVAIKGIGKVSGGLFSIGRGAVTAYKSVKALHDGFKGIELAENATKGEKAWAKFGGVLSKTFSGLKTGFSWLGKGIVTASKELGGKFLQQLKLAGRGIKSLGSSLLNGAKAIGSKALSAGKLIGSKITQGIKATTKFSMGKRLATGALAGAAVATPEAINAVKDRHSANKRSQDIGGAVGALVGGTLTSMIPVVGPMLAPVGAIIGKYAGRWGGQAVNNFTKGWQKNKPPKKFWSLENLGWSTHNMFRQVGKWGAGVGKNFAKGINKGKSFAKRNSKELALTAVSPLLGIPALLYKNNPKFRKWANGVGKSIKSGLSKAGKAVNHFKSSLSKNFKKAWDNVYKHSSKGTKQIMRSVSRFAKSYIKTNSKANKETIKNFASFSKRLKKNHGDLFKTIGQTAKKQLAIEKKRWSSNWKNIRSTAQGIWKGLNHNASDMYKKLNTATHGGLGKVLSGFKSFGKGIKDFWNGLWKGITKTFDDTVKHLQDAANNVGKFFTGKLKVGSLHLANGTDWKHKYGYPAILNDGHDSPATGNREGILNPDGTVEVQNGVNIKRWIFPWQDVINAHDMARIFGCSVRLANGTVNLRSLETNDPTKFLSTLTKLTKKKYDEDRQHHEKQKQRHDRNDNDRATERKRLIKQEHDAKSERAKIAKEIREALSKGRNTKGLTAQLNALTKHISNIKHSIAKTNPHHGQVYVDEGLLIGAKSRIGKSKWISDALFKKLTTKPKKRKTTHKRSTSHRRSTSTRTRTVTRVVAPHISGKSVRVRATVTGLSNVRSLANAISAVKSKSVKVTASGSSAKSVSSLAHAIKKIKGGTHKVTVKTRGTKSVKSLARAIKKVKGKRIKVTVKSYGSKGLKSLQRNITSTNRRVRSLTKEAKKAKFGKAISQQAVEAVKSLKGKGNFAKQFEKMTKKFDKDLKTMSKNSKKEFKSMWSENEKTSKTGETRLTHQLSGFSSKYKHGWSSLESGVHRAFSHFWTNMKNAAGKGVNSVIKVLNSAIGKIDNVISDFGGSKTAVHKSGYVHYAGGTDANGRLTQDTLAIVNDAKSGPRQEAIVTDTNDVILPQGKDVPVMLKKGWGVLNGTQTKQLGLPHFAAGTGLSLKKLYDIAKHNWSNPTKTGNSMFSAVSGLIGAMNDLASGMRDKTEKSGVNWWSQLWKMVEDKVNDDAVGKGGTREAFLKYAEKVFSGVHYQMGAASKTLSDCSGMVMQALRHFGINIGRTTVAMQESNGVQYLGKNIRKTVPGDLVIFGHGTGAAGHVGIVKNPKAGTMFNETQPYARVSRIADDVSMGYGFYRVKGLHNASDSNNPKVKANNSLQSLIKKQVGHGFWRTIQKIADKYGENSFFGGMAGKPVGDVAHWMRQAHIPKKDWAGINYIVTAESGWNPRIVNPSSGTYGLGQMQGYNLHYYTRHGSKSNPIAQLMGIMDYIHDRYGSVANAVRFRKAHNWYANGGIANKPSIFGEAGPEMAIPLIPSKSTRAWELIGKAVGILSSQTNLQVQNANNEKERKEEHDFRQAVLLLLTQLVNKSNVADIKLKTPQGRTLWEVIEPFSKAEQRAAMIKLRRGLSGR